MKQVSKNGPAFEQLSPGDLIISIDGVELEDKNSAQVVRLILGVEGTTLELIVRDPSETRERLVFLERTDLSKAQEWKPTHRASKSLKQQLEVTLKPDLIS